MLPRDWLRNALIYRPHVRPGAARAQAWARAELVLWLSVSLAIGLSLGGMHLAAAGLRAQEPQLAMVSIPGQLSLASGESVSFVLTPAPAAVAVPGQRPPTPTPGFGNASAGITVQSHADQVADVAYDGATLTIAVSLGLLQVSVPFALPAAAGFAGCTVPADRPNSIQCILSPTRPTFTRLAFSSFASGSGSRITYPSGWNLVGVPPEVTLLNLDGPLFTYQAGDRTYQAVPPNAERQAGHGYWVFFSEPTSILIPYVSGAIQPGNFQIPGGQYVLLGNPFPMSATVSGGDVVYIYDSAGSSYQQSSILAAGQGAWIYASTSRTVTIAPSQ
jgi:hypothetical protein